MTWVHPAALWLLPPAWALVGAADGWRARRRRRLLRALRADPRTGSEVANTLLVTLALTLVIVALAGPARPGRPDPVGGSSQGDVLLVLDVSRSMATRDVAPDRSAVARMAALRLASELPRARVGVAAFAADAYVLVSPTRDLGLVSQYAESLDSDAVTGQGSDLARALRVALAALPPRPGGEARGAAVLLSDGEGFEPERELAAAIRAARDEGLPVHAVLAGTERGGPVPGVVTGARSAARPRVLERIARETGGLYADAADGRALGALAARLARAPLAAAEAPPSPVGAGWLALAALVVLLVESAYAAANARGTP